MIRRNLMIAAAAVSTVVVAAGGAWWVGMHQGMAMMSSPTAVAAASADPAQWTIPQGEEATRRHIREGLKAGDIDPVTGLRILHYHDPMVPGRNFDAPARSPFMDMMLVPRYAGGGRARDDDATISVSSRMQQNLGVRTGWVVEGALAVEVDAVGNVAWNERLQEVVSARAVGFVRKLHVRATFDRVSAGAPLLDLHVPDWVAAQEDFLAVAHMRGADVDVLRDAARARMRQVGMDEDLIARVQGEGRVLAVVTLVAPRGGVVTELMVREGATVMPGAPLLRLQGTESVWADAQVPESQAALLQRGASVVATSPAVPGEVFTGRVQAVLPEVDPATRTIRARMQLSDAGARLVPGMLVQMRLTQPARDPVLLVPTEAVIHTGRRSVVLLAEADGHFRPVEVRTGQEAQGQTEVIAGLVAGQRVVLSGQFLIDSEASLRGVEARLNPSTPEPAADVYRTPARIEAIEGESITLDHPPIPELGWPRMVMDFRLPATVRRPRDLAPGEQVEVEFQMQDADVPRITGMHRALTGATK